MRVVIGIFKGFSWEKITRHKIFSFCILVPIAAISFLAASTLVLYQRDVSIFSLALAGGAGVLLLVARSEPK